jgi:predicted DNA-binding transcriptional regulator YafY
MMFIITGLDKLSRDLDGAQKALSEMDGELGAVSFKPDDPASIEAAIQLVDGLVDSRLGAYASNSIIGPLAEQMKEKYRQAILDKAAAARLGGVDVDGE